MAATAEYALMADVRAMICDFLYVADLSGPEMAYLQDKIEKIPAADVRENVRGEWKWIQSYNDVKCTVCGEVYPYDDVCLFKYCPNCGANMRGEKDEPR